MSSRWKTVLGLTLVLVLTLYFFGGALAEPSATGATITTDLPDYNPGGTVTLSGAGWAPGEVVDISVNDDAGQTWSLNSDPDPTADLNGIFIYTFQLPNWFVASYTVTATGAISGSATANFTDANPSANLDQCANDPFPSPSTDGCDANASQWENGNLNASKAVFFEGDSIPYRMRFDNLSLTSHTVTIEWDTTKSSTHALDYLTSFNATVASANPCLDVSGCSASTPYPIPADPQITGAGVTPAAGSFTLYGGAITAVSAYSYADGTGFTGDKSARITITFTATSANPVLAWGGHIASREDWGLDNGAASIPGSPYHMRLIDLDGSGGNQDRSLSADAVIFPGSITIIKDATPNSSTDFSFTASPSPLADFSLVDDGTSTNTELFADIIDFTSYTVAELVPSGWALDVIDCSVTSPNGGSQTTDLASDSVTINLKEGENVTCTFSDSQKNGTIVIVKDAVPNAAQDFSFNLNNNATVDQDFSLDDDSDPTLPNSQTFSVPPGSWTASELSIPSGWDLTSLVCSDPTSDTTVDLSTGVASITLAPDETVTCTFTDTQRGNLVIVKNTSGADGTFAFTTTGGDGVPANLNVTTSSGTGSQTYNNIIPGTYSVSETSQTGWTLTSSSCDSGTPESFTIAPGGTVTCTFNNTAIQPQLTVIKVVNNNYGGTLTPADFSLYVDSTQVDSSTANTFSVGSHTVSEGALPAGYEMVSITGDCSSNGIVDLALGDDKTCTITNTDIQPQLTLVKTVVNNYGGTLAVADFPLFIDSTSAVSGTAYSLNAGSYTASETQQSGYTASAWGGDCAADGTVTLVVGDNKTCSITNSDLQPTLTLIKTVINDNGGTKQTSDFPLFIDSTQVTSGTANSLNAGLYTASETALFGYTASAWGGDCAANGSVTLAVGDNKTCTITNDDVQPQITLVKTVINDHGGMKQVADFPLFIGSLAVTSDVAYGIDAGTYTASETQQYGYTASAWGGDCAADGSITLSVGDAKTCTITNNDDPGIIVIMKITKPLDSGSFTFTTTGAGYNGFTIAGGGQDIQSLNAGAYTVTELSQPNWLLTGIGGYSSTPTNAPYDCNVIGSGGSGGSSGVGDLMTQTATIDLKNGDTVVCIFENTQQGATRTQGFWATHPQLAELAWFGGTAYGHTFPGVSSVSGIGDALICGRTIDSLDKLMGGFWSKIPKISTGDKRTSIDQLRMQLLQQILAAELNASAFNSVPSGGTAKFAAWESALCGSSSSAIKTALQQAAAFNSQGDTTLFSPGTSADSRYGRSVADIPYWDIIKP